MDSATWSQLLTGNSQDEVDSATWSLLLTGKNQDEVDSATWSLLLTGKNQDEVEVVLSHHNSLCKKLYNKGPPPLHGLAY